MTVQAELEELLATPADDMTPKIKKRIKQLQEELEEVDADAEEETSISGIFAKMSEENAKAREEANAAMPLASIEFTEASIPYSNGQRFPLRGKYTVTDLSSGEESMIDLDITVWAKGFPNVIGKGSKQALLLETPEGEHYCVLAR